MEKILLSEVKASSKRHGWTWFSQETTCFFGSKYPKFAYKVNNDAYFITSEQMEKDCPRRYSIRACDLLTGSITTVGEFQEYSLKEEAGKALMLIIG